MIQRSVFLDTVQKKGGLSANDDTLSHNVSELDCIPEDEELTMKRVCMTRYDNTKYEFRKLFHIKW